MALAAALNARHVALWRPDRLDERLAVAAEMIDVARDGDRVAELQARNWRVLDLFELGDMDEWRAEVRRHGRLADELRLPTFQWYTPLWQAVDAMLAGRFAEAERLRLEAAATGTRAGDLNAELFAKMIEFTANVMRGDFLAPNLEFALDKVANSPAGPAYRPSVAWLLAELGRHEEARTELARCLAPGGLVFDANWTSAIGECASAACALGDREHAAMIYDLLAPFAGRPITAGRAVASYGAADRLLGELAALLGREDDAERHLARGDRAQRGDGRHRLGLPESRGALGAAAREPARSGLHVDRHVRRAQRGERLAPPPAPAALEPHPRQARHQVELGGPGVAHLDRAGLDPAVDEVVVLAAQPLGDDVVDVERDAARGPRATAGPSGPAAAAAARARAPRSRTARRCAGARRRSRSTPPGRPG